MRSALDFLVLRWRRVEVEVDADVDAAGMTVEVVDDAVVDVAVVVEEPEAAVVVSSKLSK